MEIYCRTCGKLVVDSAHVIDCAVYKHDFLLTMSLQIWKDRGGREGYLPYVWEPTGGMLGKLIHLHDNWSVDMEGWVGRMQLFPSYVIFVQK